MLDKSGRAHCTLRDTCVVEELPKAGSVETPTHAAKSTKAKAKRRKGFLTKNLEPAMRA